MATNKENASNAGLKKTKAKNAHKDAPQQDPDKAKALAQLEKAVEAGWDSFITVGQALAEIRDKELYRHVKNPAKSFSGYLLKRWGNRMTGYRHIKAYQVHGLLKSAGVVDPSSCLHTEAEYLKLAGQVILDDSDSDKEKLSKDAFKANIENMTSKVKAKDLNYGILKKAVGIPPKPPVVRDSKLSKEERIDAFRKKLRAQIEAKLKVWKAKNMSVSLDELIKGLGKD